MRRLHQRLITLAGLAGSALELDSLNWDELPVLQCSAPLRVSGSSVSLPLPQTVAPMSLYWLKLWLMASGYSHPSQCAAEWAKLPPVTGATMYTLTWYPHILPCYARAVPRGLMALAPLTGQSRLQ